MSFNDLEKTVGEYPDILNKRLKQMLQYGLIKPTENIVEGRNRINHRLTVKREKLMHRVKEFTKCGEELESRIFS